MALPINFQLPAQPANLSQWNEMKLRKPSLNVSTCESLYYFNNRTINKYGREVLWSLCNLYGLVLTYLQHMLFHYSIHIKIPSLTQIDFTIF